MDISFRNLFLQKWSAYFGKSELPVTFFYSDEPGNIDRANLPDGHTCIVCELGLVRKGISLAWNVKSLGCSGARRYLGFTEEVRPDFDYFLSYGIPGKVEGERYLKSPELVKEVMSNMNSVPARGQYIIFKRFDQLTPEDDPSGVIFFAKPDVLSGLFTLANYDQPDGNGVIAPFASGCGAMVHQPLLQNELENPKAILGMFDVSARPCVQKDLLSFAVAMRKFITMAGYMDDCFLITDTWRSVKKRF